MSYLEPWFVVEVTAIFIFILTALIVIFKEDKWGKYKKVIFLLYIIPVLLTTFFLVGHTIVKNIQSETGGPVHWHADFEVIACGEKLDLVNPRGLNNKIGSPLFHEHNDNRIHVEGAVKSVSDIEVGDFFRVIGGELKPGLLIYDVEGIGKQEYRDGDLCPNGEPGYVQFFVNGVKMEDMEYLYYPHALVPPGDCFTVEFGPLKDSTDVLCPSWQVQGWTYDNYKEQRPAIQAYGRSWEGTN